MLLLLSYSVDITETLKNIKIFTENTHSFQDIIKDLLAMKYKTFVAIFVPVVVCRQRLAIGLSFISI